MQKRVIWFVVLVLLLIVNGCGNNSGGGGSSSFDDESSENNPVFYSPDEISINENQVYVFKLRADDKNPVKYYISGEDANRFELDAITGEVTFKESADYEIQSVYHFTATATDAIGHRTNQNITIKILDVDEDLSDVTSPNFASSIKRVTVQDSQMGVFRAIATDKNVVTYRIHGGEDAGDFMIDSGTGLVTFVSAPSYEIQHFYRFTVLATDSQGNSSSQEVEVTVLPSATQTTSTPTSTYPTSQTGFTRDDANEVVIEHEVGLMWQDNEEAKTTIKRWIKAVNFDSGKYNDTSGYTAKTYCSNLTLAGYGDWRVPTLDELEHTLDESRDDAPYIRSSFKNTISNVYWTSDTHSYNTEWGVDFENSSIDDYFKYRKKYVRCVRNME